MEEGIPFVEPDLVVPCVADEGIQVSVSIKITERHRQGVHSEFGWWLWLHRFSHRGVAIYVGDESSKPGFRIEELWECYRP